VKFESLRRTTSYWVGQEKQGRYNKEESGRLSLTRRRGQDGRICEVLQEIAAFESSGGSLVAIPDCKPAIQVQIRQSPQPTVDCQSLDGLPSGMVLHCRLSSEGRQRRINT
jgi:hypothetical protein